MLSDTKLLYCATGALTVVFAGKARLKRMGVAFVRHPTALAFRISTVCVCVCMEDWLGVAKER